MDSFIEGFEKQALIGMVARTALKAVKPISSFIARNPLKSGGAALTAAEGAGHAMKAGSRTMATKRGTSLLRNARTI